MLTIHVSKSMHREIRPTRCIATERDLIAAHISEWSATNARTIDGALRAYHRAMAATRAMRDMGDDCDDDA